MMQMTMMKTMTMINLKMMTPTMLNRMMQKLKKASRPLMMI